MPSSLLEKGRFRIVKGAVTEVKKGRFIVKKGAVPATNPPPPGEAAAKCGNRPGPQAEGTEATEVARDGDAPKPCTKKKGRFLVTTNGGARAGTTTKSDAPNHALRTTDGGEVEKSKRHVIAEKGALNNSNIVAAAPPTSSSSVSAKSPCTKKKGRFLIKTNGGARGGTATKGDAPNHALQTTDEGDESKINGIAEKGTFNNTNIDAAAPPASSSSASTKSPCTKKKGRFLVTTGHATPLAATGEATDNKTKIPPQVAVKGTDIKCAHTSAVLSTTSKPTDTQKPFTKKKGRFLVTTGGAPLNSDVTEANPRPLASGVTTADREIPLKAENCAKQHTDRTKLDKKAEEIKGNVSEALSSKGVATAAQGVKKKGRFTIKTTNPLPPADRATPTDDRIPLKAENDASQLLNGANYNTEGEDIRGNASGLSLDVTTVQGVKKKGRFTIKTGAAAGLVVTSPVSVAPVHPGPVLNNGGTPDCTRQKSENIPHQFQDKANQDMGGGEITANVSDVLSEPWANNETSAVSSQGVPAVVLAQGVKKKGRFTVKTGAAVRSATTSPVKAAPPDPQFNGNQALQLSALQHTRAYSHPLTGIQTTTSLMDANGNMFTGMPTTTTSLVDMNGHLMVLSNVPLSLSQAVPPHPLNQVPVASNFVNPPVHGTTVSVGSQTQSPQMQPPPESAPCDPLANPSLHTSPLSQPRAVVDERLPSNAHAPRPPRPTGASGANSSTSGRAPSDGKLGRLIGTGGVGKALHYLDTIRSELVEADRAMVSLQSDNRFLVSAYL